MFRKHWRPAAWGRAPCAGPRGVGRRVGSVAARWALRGRAVPGRLRPPGCELVAFGLVDDLVVGALRGELGAQALPASVRETLRGEGRAQDALDVL